MSVVLAKRWVVFTPNVVSTCYNRLTGILFVARKNRNDSYLSSFIELTSDNSGIQEDHNITKVKIPFYFTVTVRENIAQDKDGPPHYATYEIIRKKFPPFSFYRELREEPNVVGWTATPFTLTFTNKCPKCHTLGRPVLDKKDNKDYTHYKSDYDREEYRLIYFHKQEGKKDKPHIISSFDKNHMIFLEKGWLSQRTHDCIFPNYLNKNS